MRYIRWIDRYYSHLCSKWMNILIRLFVLSVKRWLSLINFNYELKYAYDYDLQQGRSQGGIFFEYLQKILKKMFLDLPFRNYLTTPHIITNHQLWTWIEARKIKNKRIHYLLSQLSIKIAQSNDKSLWFSPKS